MADWPQWRGATRDGISPETGWRSQFGGGGPKKLWSVRIGEGYSAVSVSKGRVYTFGNENGKDYVACLDAVTGRDVWKQSYAQGAGDYGGTRATPLVAANRVYTLSREGQAHAWDAASGRPLWRRDVAGELRAESPQWGFAGSPLAVGKNILYNVGTAGVALDAGSGGIAWSSGGGRAGYASPVPVPGTNGKMVAIFAAPGLIGVNALAGGKSWTYPWDTSYDVNAADPIFLSGNRVFISSNYGKGCAMLRYGGTTPTLVWQNRSMKNHFNTSVVVNGGIFGNDENTLRCIDATSGAERWAMRGMDKGGLIAADGKLIALTGRGELVIAQATPAKFTEISRSQVADGTFWTHPVLSNGLLYCRSHEGTLTCLDLRGAGKSSGKA